MGILSLASRQSVYRGYEYWEQERVHGLKNDGDGILTATVSGSEDKIYEVAVNIAHPRKSSCTCPHAAGRQLVCKHMVAVYFTAYPSETHEYKAQLEAAWEDDEDALSELQASTVEAVSKMKKAELQDVLLQMLFDGPMWQLECFVREHTDYYY